MGIYDKKITGSNGINYTKEVDGPSDWAGIAYNTFFKDLSDGLIYWKNTSGDVIHIYEVSGGGGGGGGSSVINDVKVTLTPAQLLAIDVTPIQATVAKVGVTFEVLTATLRVRYNTTAYNGGADVRIITTGADRWQYGSPGIDSSADSNGLFTRVGGGGNIQLIENAALEIYSGNPITLGDSEVDVYITYREVTL
tara:strand:+ start:36274 stop:36858 length:585 start_codon:yes stop_codon:yes gene_type:complete